MCLSVFNSFQLVLCDLNTGGDLALDSLTFKVPPECLNPSLELPKVREATLVLENRC